jgi:Zn-dependent protease
MLNLLNLIPIWILDGGQAIAALNKNERIALITAALQFAVLLSERVFPLVAGTKDMPEEPSRGATLYYLAFMAALRFLPKVITARGA